jgi:hypothetical protein
MTGSRIGDFLFGFPDKPLTREERIAIIKERIHDEKYLTQERLDQALEKMLEEIRET